MKFIFASAAALLVGYSIGKALGWEQGYGVGYDEGQAEGVQPADPRTQLWRCQDGYVHRLDEECPRHTFANVEPVAFTPEEAMALLTREWGADLRDEWSYNR